MLKASAVSSNVDDNLRLAMSIELATLPVYLYAYWSIRSRADGGSEAGVDAARAIRSIIFEEMLHLGIVSNVLSSVGGTVALTSSVPTYPGSLPGHVTTGPYAFTVSLQPLCAASVEMMEKIELPQWDVQDPPPESEGWVTLGEFYDQILLQLRGSTFSPVRQLPSHDNPSPGKLLPVTDYETAVRSIKTITLQGEGRSAKNEKDGFHELSHYGKLEQVSGSIQKKLLDVTRDVYPVISNPVASAYSSAQREANDRFNAIYSALLDSLQQRLSGDGTPEVWGGPTSLMNQLEQAAAVLRNAGNVPGTNLLAGPTFEYVSTISRAH